MTAIRQFVGTIAEKDGMLALQTQPNCWFPLGGNSGIAETFRESFGDAQRSDLGKQLWWVNGVLQMENEQQKREREERAKA